MRLSTKTCVFQEAAKHREKDVKHSSAKSSYPALRKKPAEQEKNNSTDDYISRGA
jgi:hypothetical protein